MVRLVLALVLASVCLPATVVSADEVQRPYVLDCGRNTTRAIPSSFRTTAT
jgi:hypothetical protein